MFSDGFGQISLSGRKLPKKAQMSLAKLEKPKRPKILDKSNTDCLRLYSVLYLLFTRFDNYSAEIHFKYVIRNSNTW